MIRIFKVCFWIAVVVFFLPEDFIGKDDGSNVTTASVIEYAKSGITNIDNFCDNNPEACLRGTKTAKNLSTKTINTARSIYEYLQNESSDNKSLRLEQVLPIAKDMTIEEQIRLAETLGQTLTMADLNINTSN